MINEAFLAERLKLHAGYDVNWRRRYSSNPNSRITLRERLVRSDLFAILGVFRSSAIFDAKYPSAIILRTMSFI